MFITTRRLLLITICISSSITANSENKWKNYLKKIQDAENSYKECVQEDCSCHLGVMDADFEIWESRGGIKKSDFDSAKSRGGNHYQILNHKLYRQEQCMFPFRCTGVEHFILQIIDRLPDMEFMLNERDYPSASKHGPPLPILSFSKVVSDNWDIMYPAWTFWAGGPAVWPIYPRGLGRWDLQREIIPKAAEEWPWEKKDQRAFFRGSRTSVERDPLILLSRSNPELADAQYTKNQAWKSEKDTLNMAPATEIELKDHCKYKYLFNFRGVAASFRYKHLFLCDSLVLHVGDDWQEFFYAALKPWYHYIPVKSDLSDARKLIEFAKENDVTVRKIAQRGREFIWRHLRMEDVTCYWEKLLLRYARLTSWTPSRHPGLLPITPNSKDEL